MKSNGRAYCPLVYCAVCRKCKNRTWKNLFSIYHLVTCGDINGMHIKTIIPGILWCVDCCKLRYTEDT